MSVLSRIVQCHSSSVKKHSKTLLRPIRGYGYFQLFKKNILKKQQLLPERAEEHKGVS